MLLKRPVVRYGTMAAVLALTLGLAPFGPDAEASVADDADTGEPGLSVSELRIQRPERPATRSLAIWQTGRTGYLMARGPGEACPTGTVLDHASKGDVKGVLCANGDDPYIDATTYHQLLTAYDLDTGAEKATIPLSPWGYGDTNGFESMAVDEENGLLYVAYGNRPRNYTDGASFGGTIVHHDLTSGADQTRSLCASMQQYKQNSYPANSTCVGGFHVFRTDTLESVGRIPLENVRIEGAHLSPRVLGLQAIDGKLRVLVQDRPHRLDTSANGGATSASERTGMALHYLLQADGTTGATEWLTRIDGCRAPREAAEDSSKHVPYHVLPAPGLVFSSPADADAVYVGCHNGSSRSGTVVRVPLDESGNAAFLPVEGVNTEEAAKPLDGQDPAPQNVAPQAPAQSLFFGPDRTLSWLSDAGSGRILARVVDNNQEVWWVFDTGLRRWVGTIGIGEQPGRFNATISGIDQVTGRLYALSAERGLLIADVRTTPVAQALAFPQFGALMPAGQGVQDVATIDVLARSGDLPARLFVPDTMNDFATHHRVIEDARPASDVIQLPSDDGRTLDIEEAEGVTSVAFDGAARGYGARVLLVGGIDAVGRAGPIDPIGDAYGARDTHTAAGKNVTGPVGEVLKASSLEVLRSPCTDGNRDITLGFVGPDGPAVLDGSGGRATADPVSTDTALRADSELPVSRCAPVEWNQLWSQALFGNAPTAEPTAPWLFGEESPSCLSGSEKTTDTQSDPVFGRFSAEVSCEDGTVSGWSQARGAHMDGVSVAQAMSSFDVYRDPVRGIVARVESVARGIAVDGVARIDSVRTIAESWANGRRQPVADADREEGYDANCDYERTAGTCFRRQIAGVWTPGYACGPCGDENALLNGLNRAMGANGTMGFRDPDRDRARGSESGFQAAVSKSDPERFADLVLNNDLLQTMVPGLEFVRYAPPARKVGGGGPRGRQIFQFAGVEVSSSYGIECLLVYDEATNTCAEPAEAPGSIQITLSDTDGEPLAGGAFEVREDVDADGVLGLKDTLLPDGACVTAEDGIGTCTFDNLQPGTYLVSQVAAPPGYAKSAEPWVSEVASGEQRTVAFTNVSNVSTIDLKATDEHGAPLSGATFAAYPDPDSDGKVAPDAQPAAECTTDDQGVCTMKVPAGSYVLVQTSAPGGLEGIEPVPFTFASGGQVASVTVVNYPPASPEQPAAAAAPIDYTPPVDYARPVESVTVFTPVAEAPVVEEPTVSVPERIGGTVTQVIRAPGDALRLLARDPKQAVAWTAALALFVLAAMAVRRRQQAIELLRAT